MMLITLMLRLIPHCVEDKDRQIFEIIFRCILLFSITI